MDNPNCLPLIPLNQRLFTSDQLKPQFKLNQGLTKTSHLLPYGETAFPTDTQHILLTEPFPGFSTNAIPILEQDLPQELLVHYYITEHQYIVPPRTTVTIEANEDAVTRPIHLCSKGSINSYKLRPYGDHLISDVCYEAPSLTNLKALVLDNRLEIYLTYNLIKHIGTRRYRAPRRQ